MGSDLINHQMQTVVHNPGYMKLPHRIQLRKNNESLSLLQGPIFYLENDYLFLNILFH